MDELFKLRNLVFDDLKTFEANTSGTKHPDFDYEYQAKLKSILSQLDDLIQTKNLSYEVKLKSFKKLNKAYNEL